jgi:hypothetical protein
MPLYSNFRKAIKNPAGILQGGSIALRSVQKAAELCTNLLKQLNIFFLQKLAIM